MPVSIEPAELSPGDHRAMLYVVHGEESGEVPVEVTVNEPIVFLPSRLFFGEIEPGERAKRSVTVVARIAPGTVAGPLELTTSTPEGLPAEVTVDRIDVNRWTLSVELADAATRNPGLISDSIAVVVDDGRECALQAAIPILARVKR